MQRFPYLRKKTSQRCLCEVVCTVLQPPLKHPRAPIESATHKL
uniref:Uncharacterized protein n=1 Tax=Anguilla anguilla TaxID=7936 RepID=A0A0E9S470_ANGAN